MKLTSDELKIVREILNKCIPRYAVWAFGSRVHGRLLKQFSDLDLVIITEQPLPTNIHQDLADAFSNSDLPFKVDILDWARIEQNFREKILLEYEIIQTADI